MSDCVELIVKLIEKGYEIRFIPDATPYTFNIRLSKNLNHVQNTFALIADDHAKESVCHVLTNLERDFKYRFGDEE